MMSSSVRFVLASNNNLFHLHCELLPSFVIGCILHGKDPSVRIKHTNTIVDDKEYFTSVLTEDDVYLADIDDWLRFSRKSLSDLSTSGSVTKYRLKDISERHPGWGITVPGGPQVFDPSQDKSARKYGIVIAYKQHPHGYECVRYLFIDGFFYCLSQFEIMDIKTKQPICVEVKKDDLLEAKVYATDGLDNYQEQLEIIQLQCKLIEAMEAKIGLLTKVLVK